MGEYPLTVMNGSGENSGDDGDGSAIASENFAAMPQGASENILGTPPEEPPSEAEIADIARPSSLVGVFRHRNYRLFFFGQLVSVAGTWMQTVAQSFVVLGDENQFRSATDRPRIFDLNIHFSQSNS